MSGNFDFPPASGRGSRQEQPQAEVPSIAARLQNLRNLLGSERYRDRDDYQQALALETLDQELGELGPDPPSRRADRRRRRREREPERELLREHNTFPSITSQMEQELGSNEPGSSSRIRRRPVGSTEPLSRFRDRGRNTSTDALHGLQWAAARLAETTSSVNASVSALLDEPVSHMGSSGRGPVGAQVNRWRAKRRKLDSDDKREGTRGFSYGHHGQVVPGALKMEIASCDGGTYSEPNGDSSWPENVLINDSSVYCTQSDRCNLILRHQGEAPFCLKKIVIRAPKTGFDAPIQEGMVFVSMTSDELLARTAQYQIQYSPARRRARRCRMNRAQPSQEYFNSIRSPLQSLERTVLADPGQLSDAEMDTTVSTYPRPGQLNRRNSAAEFRVTTDFDDRSDDGEEDQESGSEVPSAADFERIRMEQLDAGLLCPEEDEDDDDSESDGNLDEMTSAFHRGRLEMRRRMRAARIMMGDDHDIEGRRRMVPSLIEPTGPPASGDGVGNQHAQSAPEVMKPHARFFIEREKSMVSIKFDPPASGRFILIKLWSPYSGGNIDIQSIVAHGFAGPRFFPAMGFR